MKSDLLLTYEEIQELSEELYHELFNGEQEDDAIYNMHKKICKIEKIPNMGPDSFQTNEQFLQQYKHILDYDKNNNISKEDFIEMADQYLNQDNLNKKKKIKIDQKLSKQANEKVKQGFQEFWEIDVFRQCYLDDGDDIKELVLKTHKKWGQNITDEKEEEKIIDIFFEFCVRNQVQDKLYLQNFEEYMLEQLEQQGIQLYEIHQ